MAQDHDRLDRLFKDFQRLKAFPPKAKGFFCDFKVGLQRHIVWEDEILFPVFEKKSGMYNHGPTIAMRKEHLVIRELLDALHEGVKKGDLSDIPDERFSAYLLQHNLREENVLYPWIESQLSEDEQVLIFQRFNDIVPQKWSYCCTKPI